MKLYIAAGQYVGTQAEAKALSKEFKQVEVPTDKEGLIAYLNFNIAYVEPQDEFETVVERQDPPIESPTVAEAERAEHTTDIEDLWEHLPLHRQAHLCALFAEEVRVKLKPTPTATLTPAPADDDEDLFA